uniref:Polyprotein n=1 Tax=Cajanus cajan TaxID=3821 RepID=A0A151U1T3_CAJCA|nr:polyprotein [Cajanus cajan]
MESHKKLLNQFLERANLYGIMFSEKKIQLAQREIDFLGMKFSQGTYQPQPHIAEELLNFPEGNITVKQIQQFLGIINYIRDFIPKIARYTSPFSKMLKKDPPPWGSEQTQAVQEIKKIAQDPPALKIPGDGKRILQTDAGDHYWGAVFIEEVQGKKFYCGHASGQFKEAEKHYHTTYKEALAVKNGIKKFDFHLRGHHFEVQMDNSSFPKILEFKNKLPPEP